MRYYIILPSFIITRLSIIFVCITILRNIIKYMINCYDSLFNDCKRVASILLRFVNILSTRLQKDEKSCFNCVPGYVCNQIFDLIPNYNTTQVIKDQCCKKVLYLYFETTFRQIIFQLSRIMGFIQNYNISPEFLMKFLFSVRFIRRLMNRVSMCMPRAQQVACQSNQHFFED